MATNTLPVPTRLLSPEEAARRLGVKEGTLGVWRSINWIRKNRRNSSRYMLPFVRIGAKIYYREIDIEEYINRSLVNPQESKPKQK